MSRYLLAALGRPTHRSSPPSRHRPPSTARRSPHAWVPADGPLAPSRFEELDAYRVEREWKRYEGTPQRDLFRELRGRFLDRHVGAAGWVLDIGCGPGRFLPRLLARSPRTVGLDVSLEMLRSARARFVNEPSGRALVRADARRPPIRSGAIDSAILLGNTIGFAGSEGDDVVGQAVALVAPGGRLILEVAPGNGERSRYLARLPPGAVRRLMAAPVNLVRTRLEREGFLSEPRSRLTSGFLRVRPGEIRRRLETEGLRVREVVAVAPAIGADAARTAAVQSDPAAWGRLLEVEEAVGRGPARHAAASALLIAAERPARDAPAVKPMD